MAIESTVRIRRGPSAAEPATLSDAGTLLHTERRAPHGGAARTLFLVAKRVASPAGERDASQRLLPHTRTEKISAMRGMPNHLIILHPTVL